MGEEVWGMETQWDVHSDFDLILKKSIQIKTLLHKVVKQTNLKVLKIFICLILFLLQMKIASYARALQFTKYFNVYPVFTFHNNSEIFPVM